MSRTTVTFTVSLPPLMADELEEAMKQEYRTRSELVREALRRYLHTNANRDASFPTDLTPRDLPSNQRTN
jgi:metal-responsive CopG/Arc/MetJ family transcriptional regulator